MNLEFFFFFYFLKKMGRSGDGKRNILLGCTLNLPFSNVLRSRNVILITRIEQNAIFVKRMRILATRMNSSSKNR